MSSAACGGEKDMEFASTSAQSRRNPLFKKAPLFRTQNKERRQGRLSLCPSAAAVVAAAAAAIAVPVPQDKNNDQNNDPPPAVAEGADTGRIIARHNETS